MVVALDSFGLLSKPRKLKQPVEIVRRLAIVIGYSAIRGHRLQVSNSMLN